MNHDPLSTYRAKRSLDRTPEPAGAVGGAGGRLFVVHKHAARHLHWDLRLEMDGVLRSWAVPKGPSADPAEKRLAILVEDHPVEYGDFEGRIPEGNYGAGSVIVWDRGQWLPVGDPGEGLAKGKLLFELRGHKLRGLWTLVKLKKGDREWLFIKERDGHVERGPSRWVEASVLSGLTVEDLAAGRDPGEPVRAALAARRPPAWTGPLTAVSPMLCEPGERAFNREGWLFELKLDGYRILAVRDGGQVTLLSRAGRDYAAVFPEVTRAVAALPHPRLVLDGEVVALDEQGRPSFHRLQQRGRLTRPAEVRRAAVELPVTYYLFDLLAYGDRDLRSLPLLERKELLARVLPPLGSLRLLEHFEGRGADLMAQVERLGLEGIVAKKASAPYRAGRGPQWLKIRAERTADFAVAGYTAPRGSRAGFGALLLAEWVDGVLTYAGRVGTGFSHRDLREIRAALDPAARPAPAVSPPAAGGGKAAFGDLTAAELKAVTWVEPTRVCEVRFTERTRDGLLRHPAFSRWRDDKRVEDCERRDAAPAAVPAPRTFAYAAGSPRPGLEPTNTDKVYWPADGTTKGDLLAYYREIAPWMLPYLRDRPLVLTRYPDGIDGKSFYQKDAPAFVPGWIRAEPVWSEDTGREIRYFVCDDVEQLLYVVNLGSIPLHVWASRVGSLERPDWCVLDLDPKGAPFRDVVTIARLLHDVCDDAGLPNHVKTTGKTGLHVLVPLGRQCTWEQSRALGEVLARLVVREVPAIATITRTVSAREGKVYVDFLQNRRGQTIVAPFSVRPLPGATVSTPLAWKEVSARLDITRHTIRTVPARLRRLGTDPMAAVLTEVPDLAAVLGRLTARLGR